MDAAQNFGLLFSRNLLALDALVQKPVGIGLAPIRRILRSVNQDHVDPGIGRDICNPSPHHARPDDANLFHGLIGHRWPVRTLLQRLFVDEQGTDHRGGGGVHQQRGEVPRLDLDRGVKGHKRALIDRAQQFLRSRIDPHGLARHHGIGADKGHEPGRMIGRAAGHFIALVIPRLHEVCILGRQHPVLGAGQEVFWGDDLINQPGHFGGFGIRQFAFQQEGGRHHRAQLARQARGAATAGEDADKDFWQANLGAWIVGGNDAVAGKGKFQPDAQRRAGQGCDNRLATLLGLRVHPRKFDLAQHVVHAHDAIKDRLSTARPHGSDHLKVHPAREIFLGAGDDDALGRRVGQGPVHHARQVHKRLGRHHVHRLVLDVPGQGHDAIGVHRIGEIGHHWSPLGAI